MYRNPFLTSTFVCVVLALMPQVFAQEETEAPSYGAGVDVMSSYVWFGTIISADPVIQPEAWFSYNGWTIDVWNNVDLTDYEIAPWRVTETDWTVEYGFDLKGVEMAVGYIYYTFPNLRIDDTQEVYASACFDVLLSPSVEVYYDFDEIGGVRATGSIGYAVPMGDGEDAPSVEFGAALDYGDSSYISGCFDDVGACLVDMTFSCQVPLAVSEHVSITPMIAYMQVLDKDLRACTDKSESLYGGVSVTAEF